MAAKKKKTTSLKLELKSYPHNGAPGYQQECEVTHPVTGKVNKCLLGGQQLLIFLAVYVYSRFIAPVGRRFGKTTSLPFLVMEESRITAGHYYCLFIAQSHDKAYEMMEFCQEMWGGVHDPKLNPGGMVKRRVGGPNDQRRFLDVFPFDIEGAPQINSGIRVYFVSGAHPHYKKIRGYPHHMNRVVCDEFAQIHPLLRKVVFPMLADCNGRFLAIGTTDEDEIGNVQFSEYYERGLSTEPRFVNWGCMNFPSMANGTLSKEGLEETINDCVTDDDLQQEVYARFLTGKGSVFSNLDQVLVLKPTICNGDPANWPKWVNEIQTASLKAMKNADDISKSPPDVWIHAEYDPAHDYVMSADWAKDRDHTIMGVYNLSTMKQVAVLRFHGDAYTSQFIWAHGVKEHYQAHEFHGDENSGAGASMGDLMRVEYATGVIPHKFGPTNKGSYVRRGQIIFYEARIELIKVTAQYAEFKDYKKFLPDTESGQSRVRYSHPPGKHDDFIDSFLHVTEVIIDGQRAMAEAKESKGFNMVDEDGAVDMSYWEDAPSHEKLEEMYEAELEAYY